MNILVSNIYSWQNKGDAAIVVVLIQDLARQFPGSVITLSSLDPRDEGRYGPYVVHPSILWHMKHANSSGSGRFLMRLRYAIACLLFRLRLRCFKWLLGMGLRAYWLFGKSLRTRIRDFEKADLVVACGGGYLLMTWPRRRLSRWLGCNDLDYLCMDFSIARMFGKPYILHNQSIGPFRDDRDFERIRPHLSGANAILCREEFTYDRLAKKGFDNIVLRPDAAFRLEPVAEDIFRHKVVYGKLNIGITARQCLGGIAQDEYESKLARFITHITETGDDTQVYFMPQVIYELGHDNDLLVAGRIRDKLNSAARERFCIIDDDLHPSVLMGIIGKMDYFVGTRMHSNIFALSSVVKTLAIAYEPKTDGIMKMLGLSDYVLHVASFTFEEMMHKFDMLQNDNEYVYKLRSALARIRAADSDLVLLSQQRASCSAIRGDWKLPHQSSSASAAT